MQFKKQMEKTKIEQVYQAFLNKFHYWLINKNYAEINKNIVRLQ